MEHVVTPAAEAPEIEKIGEVEQPPAIKSEEVRVKPPKKEESLELTLTQKLANRKQPPPVFEAP